MLKILQARLQQYVNQEILDVQAGSRKGRRTRDQIANIHWITEKERELQKNIYFCFTDTTLMAEKERELKSLLINVKESEKADLKLNIKKT